MAATIQYKQMLRAAYVLEKKVEQEKLDDLDEVAIELKSVTPCWSNVLATAQLINIKDVEFLSAGQKLKSTSDGGRVKSFSLQILTISENGVLQLSASKKHEHKLQQHVNKEIFGFQVVLDEQAHRDKLDAIKNLHTLPQACINTLVFWYITPLAEAPNQIIPDDRLNKCQARAVSSALDREVTLIHGPPGTGKSQTIISIALHCVRNFPDYSVLILSPSNDVIKATCARLCQRDMEDKILRVAAKYKVSDENYNYENCLKSELSKEQDLMALYQTIYIMDQGHDVPAQLKIKVENKVHKINKEIFDRRRIVLATCAMASSSVMDYIDFDLIVIDQAGKASDIDVIISIKRIKDSGKLVLVGDPCQGRPFSLTNSMYLQKSPMEKIIEENGEHCSILLDTQYRAHPSIAKIYNQIFYHEKLLDGVSKEERPYFWDPKNTEKNVVFVHVAGAEADKMGSIFNSQEADYVVFLHNLLRAKDPNINIGIIAFYKAQVREIKARLGYPLDRLTTVDTVDAYQGNENDIIIFTTARTSKVGFFADDKRVCVSMSRAKRNLYVIGNYHWLNTIPIYESVLARIKRYGAIYTTRRHHNGFQHRKMETDNICLFLGYPKNDRVKLEGFLRDVVGVAEPRTAVQEWTGTTAILKFDTEEQLSRALAFDGRLQPGYGLSFKLRFQMKNPRGAVGQDRQVVFWNHRQTIVIDNLEANCVPACEEIVQGLNGFVAVSAFATMKCCYMKVQFESENLTVAAVNTLHTFIGNQLPHGARVRRFQNRI